MPSLHPPLFQKRASAIGNYWTSSVGKPALRQYLRARDGSCFKTAASIGGEPEQGFEQAFSSLAYSLIKDKAPRLLDYIVGFQLVDRNEDNTKAMGVFGFKVGKEWLYSPIFFLSGDLKGHELLYVKSQDAFVPMKENWVNHLISRKPHELGEGSEKTTFELGGLMPNLTRLIHPPMGTKFGSAACGENCQCQECRQKRASAPLPICVDDWAKPALPMMFALANKLAHGLYPGVVKEAHALNFEEVVAQPYRAAFALTAAQFDLGNVLQSFPLLKLAYEQAYLRYPLIKLGFDRFYGPDFFLKTAENIKRADDCLVKTAESYIVPPKQLKKKKPSPFLLADEERKPLDKHAGITVYALDADPDVEGSIEKNRAELTHAEREKLLNDTVLIKDKRDPHAVSMAYDTQLRVELTNPDTGGLFDVLEKPGTFDTMLVIVSPFSGRGREDFDVVVRKSDPRNWKNINRTNLWAKQNSPPLEADFRKWWETLSSATLQKGGTYLVIGENSTGTCPFEVREEYGNDLYKVSWLDHVDRYGARPTIPRVERTPDWETGYESYSAKLRINKKGASRLRVSNGELAIPASFKILKIEEPPAPKKTDDSLIGCCSEPMSSKSESEKQPIQPGNLIDVQLMLTKEASQISVHDVGGGEIYLKSVHGNERMSKKASLIALVREHGLRQEQAREMLKEAAAEALHKRAKTYWIKYADPYGGSAYLTSGQPGGPGFPEPQRGTEPLGYNSVQSIYPQEESYPVDSLSSQMTDPTIYDPFFQPDRKAMQTAQQASQSGQKDVFDVSMLSGMLKGVRQHSLVDRYLGDLMKALDRVGRILYMFYWHQDDFLDRYGKESLPELGDSLLNTFEALGDLTLFLKEKSVAGGIGLDTNSGASHTNSEAEPNIEQSARN